MVWKRFFFLARHLPVDQHSFFELFVFSLPKKAAYAAAAAVITFLSPVQDRCKVTCNSLIPQWTNFIFQRTQLDAMVKMEPLLNVVSCWKNQTHIYVCVSLQRVLFCLRLLFLLHVNGMANERAQSYTNFCSAVLSCMLRCIYGLLIPPHSFSLEKSPTHIE